MQGKGHYQGVPIGEALVFSHQVLGKTVGTSVVKLLSADPYRTAVTFTESGTGTVTFSNDPGVTSLNGLTIYQNYHPLHINDDNHPGAAGMAWYAISDTAAMNVGILTTRLVE